MDQKYPDHYMDMESHDLFHNVQDCAIYIYEKKYLQGAELEKLLFSLCV
jgi:hypothetical protein